MNIVGERFETGAVGGAGKFCGGGNEAPMGIHGELASGAQAQPAPGIACATSTIQGADQFTRSVDSQKTSEVLPWARAAPQPLPLAMRRSGASRVNFFPSGERTIEGSRTPLSPSAETRTGFIERERDA